MEKKIVLGISSAEKKPTSFRHVLEYEGELPSVVTSPLKVTSYSMLDCKDQYYTLTDLIRLQYGFRATAPICKILRKETDNMDEKKETMGVEGTPMEQETGNNIEPEEVPNITAECNKNDQSQSEEVTSEEEELGEEDAAIEEFNPSQFGEMADAIDNMSKVLEAQRKMFDLHEELSNACRQFGISEEDQEVIHNHIKQFVEEEGDIKKATKTKKQMDEQFFTRENGTIIDIKNPVKDTAPGNFDEFAIKQSLVVYFHSSYQYDLDVQKDLDEMNKSMEEFRTKDVAEASVYVASIYKDSLEKNLEAGKEALQKMMEEGNEEGIRQMKAYLKEWEHLRSSYTFDAYINTLEKHKSIAANIIRDIRNDSQVSFVGKCYRKKLKSHHTYSTLFGMVHDNVGESLEAMFLPKEDYAKGYENLFIFGLIRFFAKEDWDNTQVTKKLHNATVILLMNLQKHTLPQDVEDIIVESMKKVWKYYLPAIPKEG